MAQLKSCDTGSARWRRRAFFLPRADGQVLSTADGFPQEKPEGWMAETRPLIHRLAFFLSVFMRFFSGWPFGLCWAATRRVANLDIFVAAPQFVMLSDIAPSDGIMNDAGQQEGRSAN
jgi:hypothetical protein